MSKISELLTDTAFVTDLLNGPCVPSDNEREFSPINPGWLDDELSAEATAAFGRLMPEELPYPSLILAERNPDALFDGVGVDDNEKRLRYIVITILPDTEFPFNYSYPLIHEFQIAGLVCWETIRAVLKACTKEMQVRLTGHPAPPILNSARIGWVSLYLGRKPYQGISRLSEQWAEAEDFEGTEADVRLYKVREMEENPLLTRLIEAYNADYPAETEGDMQ